MEYIVITDRRVTYRRLMLEYTIFPDPLAASIQLFATIGNGCEWDKDGNLASWFGYDDHREPLVPSWSTYNRGLQAQYQLIEDANALKRKFVEDNIETILDCSADMALFRPDYQETCTSIFKPCVEHAKATTFPDNIQEDWAKALSQFVGWWLARLHGTYGVGEKPGVQSFWPDHIQKAFPVLFDAHNRLYKIVNGFSIEEASKVADEIVDELLREEKEAKDK